MALRYWTLRPFWISGFFALLMGCQTGVGSVPPVLEKVSGKATQEGELLEVIDVLPRVDPPRLEVDDDLDRMVKGMEIPQRFISYKPKWSVEKREFIYQYYQKTKTKVFHVILDHGKVVALMRSGDIQMIPRTPDEAKLQLKMPTERFHLDNLLGPSLTTFAFIQKVDTHGSIYEVHGDAALPQEHWEKGEKTLTFVRKQSATFVDKESLPLRGGSPFYLFSGSHLWLSFGCHPRG